MHGGISGRPFAEEDKQMLGGTFPEVHLGKGVGDILADRSIRNGIGQGTPGVGQPIHLEVTLAECQLGFPFTGPAFGDNLEFFRCEYVLPLSKVLDPTGHDHLGRSLVLRASRGKHGEEHACAGKERWGEAGHGEGSAGYWLIRQ